MTTIQGIIKTHLEGVVGTVLVVSSDKHLLESFDNFSRVKLEATYNDVRLIQRGYRRGDIRMTCAGIQIVGLVLLERVELEDRSFLMSRIRHHKDQVIMKPQVVEIDETDSGYYVTWTECGGYLISK